MIVRFSLLVLVAAASFACGGSSTPATTAPTSGSAPAAPGVLDGKSYEVTLEIAGEKPQKDVLRFQSGKFESTECTSAGFPKGTAYDAKPEGEATSFHVMTKHPDGTSVEWTGKAKSDGIEGTAVRTMNGKPANGKFSGTAQK